MYLSIFLSTTFSFLNKPNVRTISGGLRERKRERVAVCLFVLIHQKVNKRWRREVEAKSKRAGRMTTSLHAQQIWCVLFPWWYEITHSLSKLYLYVLQWLYSTSNVLAMFILPRFHIQLQRMNRLAFEQRFLNLCTHSSVVTFNVHAACMGPGLMIIKIDCSVLYST